MNQLLEKEKYNFIEGTLLLPDELGKLIETGFKEQNGCVLFKDLAQHLLDPLDSDFKKTEYEEFVNHIHIDDYVDGLVNEFEYLKIGLEFAKKIYDNLKLSYKMNFRIAVSYSKTTYDGDDIDTYGSCVVRFYTIRPTCDQNFNIVDLDQYKTDHILIIE